MNIPIFGTDPLIGTDPLMKLLERGAGNYELAAYKGLLIKGL